jgi:type IV pilus assembly protein PilB
VSQLIEQVIDEVGDGLSDSLEDLEDLEGADAHDAGIVNLVDQIIIKALQERATDIHVEPQSKGLVIRYRIDGMLVDALTPPRAVFNGVTSRIKILSDMDIAERRAAQDGRFSFKREGFKVDVRASAVPTINGEKIVLRLLDKSGFKLSLADLGFSEEDAVAFRKAIHQPYGMVLLSGPTGSGKTTTLYSGLLELKGDSLNITTIEDPVEYQIDRINQVQVNNRKNMTFATGLRAFLRQDPDVIMVGEIRDHETADIAIRAALTGHMVFSTIHANDAPTTATRLVSMGVESFMASSALTLVAAQRLVRRNCPKCIVEYTPNDDVLMALGLENDSATYFKGEGCAACKNRGFTGRLALIEMMFISKELRQMIGEGCNANEIRDMALEQGMVTLRASGIKKVNLGLTTAEEVLRVCVSDD